MTINAVPLEIAALPKVAQLCNYSLKDAFIFGKHTSKKIKIACVELYINNRCVEFKIYQVNSTRFDN